MAPAPRRDEGQRERRTAGTSDGQGDAHRRGEHAAAAGPRESPRPCQRCAGPSASIAPCSPRSDAASEALISVSRRREPQLTEVGLTRPGASLGIAFGNTLLTPTHEQPGAGV